MPRIRPLDPLVINQIAAGEVIERPASVVKELLENSLDALATRIEIDVAQGGAELIRVVDNGEGIERDDLVLAVTSHATSKLTSADDLFRVRTMGFRGEALASIASVSCLRLRSRPPARETGHEIEVEAGRVGAAQPCGCPAGTLVEVRQLFGNTPVRRKFLRAAATEFGHVAEQFTRIALAHPRLHLVLRHNGKAVYELPVTEKLFERLELFYGRSLAETLIPVEGTSGDARLWGYVAHPSQSKSSRRGQYLFLNGRCIQDRALQHALSEAYRGLLMVGRQPIAFLFLEAPAEQVDVNVHPTKAEVRFRDGARVYRLLLSTLRTKFLGMNLETGLHVGGAARGVASLSVWPRPAAPDPERRRELQSELAAWAKEALAGWSSDAPAVLEPLLDRDPSREDEHGFEPAAVPAWGGSAREELLERFGEPPRPLAFESAGGAWAAPGELLVRAAAIGLAEPEPPAPVAAAAAAEHTSALPLLPGEPAAPAAAAAVADVPAVHAPAGPARRVMQILDSYLIAETDDGLAVIDQHARHERVLYEHLRRRVLAGSVESQRLLAPEPIELSAREAALVVEHRELLAELGFSVDEFGGSTVLLSAYPAMLARADRTALLRDLAERLDDAGAAPTRRDLLDRLLHMMSCKAAIKAGHRLSPEEMQSLLAQRHLIDDAHHCPHGRPTALVLTRAELDRQFGRLG
ncbi:MAG TPA: DNA mismatch repair endonuclease MutL [Planctomycetaceae bacterium]|nr:DNA mismatch repair endonuclease MutL [Planctomycetaceae bacterium]